MTGLTFDLFSAPTNSTGHSIFSGSALVNSLLGRSYTKKKGLVGWFFVSPRHSGSSAHEQSLAISRRVRVGRHVRHLLRLSDHGPAAMETDEGRKPETVIIDQRKETISVSNDRISYLTSKPIPCGQVLRKVVITIVSKDQGWSSHPDDHGTYHNSWTWFELSVRSPLEDSVEKWRGEVVRNIHAHGNFKEHTIEMMDGALYKEAKGGDVFTVWALARHPGWVNTVKKVTIRLSVVDSDGGELKAGCRNLNSDISVYTFTVPPLPCAPTVYPARDLVGKATLDIAALRKKLAESDVSLKGDLKVLRHVFECGDNIILEMQEEEILMIIEVFDRVKLLTHYLFVSLAAVLMS